MNKTKQFILLIISGIIIGFLLCIVFVKPKYEVSNTIQKDKEIIYLEDTVRLLKLQAVIDSLAIQNDNLKIEVSNIEKKLNKQKNENKRLSANYSDIVINRPNI